MRANFDPSLIAAEFALSILHPEDLPGAAAQALETGHDGPIIRRMAALDRPSGWEVDQLFTEFLSEMGLKPLSKQDAAVRVAYEYSRKILDERKDPMSSLGCFLRLWVESDYVSEIAGLGTMKDDAYLSRELNGSTEDQVRQEIRELLTKFVKQYDGSGSFRLSDNRYNKKHDDADDNA